MTATRCAASPSEVDREVKSIDDVSQTQIIGGERRQIRVLLDPAQDGGLRRGAGRRSCAPWNDANQRLQVGEFAAANQEYAVETGDFLRNAEDVGARGGGRFRRPPRLSARRGRDSRRPRGAVELRALRLRAHGAEREVRPVPRWVSRPR